MTALLIFRNIKFREIVPFGCAIFVCCSGDGLFLEIGDALHLFDEVTCFMKFI